MKKFSELQIAFFGLTAIFILEAIALLKGIDGVMFGSAMAGLGGIIGWVFKSRGK